MSISGDSSNRLSISEPRGARAPFCFAFLGSRAKELGGVKNGKPMRLHDGVGGIIIAGYQSQLAKSRTLSVAIINLWCLVDG